MNAVLADPEADPPLLAPDEPVLSWEDRDRPARARWLLPATALLLALGLGLRLWHLAANRSLWGDEAAIALNIRDLGFAELLAPLRYDQAAPVLWLFIERLAYLVTGSFDWALRLLPFLGGALGLVATAGLALRLLPAGAALFAVLGVALLPTHVYYAAEIKQYATDFGLAALLLLQALEMLRAQRFTPGQLIALLVTGLIAIPLSQPAVFTLAAVGATLFLATALERRWSELLRLVGIGLLWGLLFVALYLLVYSRQGDVLSAMRGYWGERFAPVPPRSVEDVFWYYKAFAAIPTAGFFYGRLFSPILITGKLLAGLLFLLGLWRLGREDWRALLLLLTPLLLAFVASALQLYPFSGRFLLFAAPGIIVLVAAGLAELTRARLPGFTAPLAAALILLLPLSLTAVEFAQGSRHRPFDGPDLKGPLAVVQGERQPGDALYLFPSLLVGYRLYGEPMGLSDMPVQGGRSIRAGIGYPMADLERLRGRGRVWVLHTLDDDSWGNSYVDELSLFRWGAARLGAREELVRRFKGATLLLLAFPPADPAAGIVFPEPAEPYRPHHPSLILEPGESLPEAAAPAQGAPAPAPEPPAPGDGG